MAKAFSEKEKTIIQNKLKQGAKECLQRFGVRKTTVDELVRIAGISKGAFYIFYPTKEALFFEIMSEFQLEVQNQILKSLKEKEDDITPERLTNLIYNMIKEIEQSFMLTMIQNGDLEYIQRKLPEDILADHRIDDDFILGELCKLLPLEINQKKIELFSASLRGVAMTLTAKKAIGDIYFDDVLMILLKGVVNELYKK
ncbi:MAG: TetR/AcrR family transcriptional regulator [Prevotellaceae bacterium]|jgi:AcrR family transcriptional regulator|nr:TetR/AcrR family transcriptional regulator [Prevotellaceae bacterium]